MRVQQTVMYLKYQFNLKKSAIQQTLATIQDKHGILLHLLLYEYDFNKYSKSSDNVDLWFFHDSDAFT